MDALIKHPHIWLSKLMGCKVEENEWMRQGKANHKIIADHILKKKIDERLKGIDLDFQEAEFKCFRDLDFTDKYALFAYIDMISWKSKSLLEIKTSTKPWSMSKFNDLNQWRLYAYMTNFKHCWFLTSDHELKGIKKFYIEATDNDYKIAEDMVKKSIDIIENQDLKQDLVNGKCDGWCSFGKNCYFYAKS